MIDKKLNSPVANLAKKMLPAHLRSEPDDEDNIDSTLGKVIISDYSDSRVLDRLSIYERRLENSLFKTITELRRTQILREMDKQKTEAEEIIEVEVEQESEENFASHEATQNEESSFWQQDTGDSEREIGQEIDPHCFAPQYLLSQITQGQVAVVGKTKRGGEKKSKTKPICRLSAGKPKF